ncbi:hypothetical protein [Wolbachia endosymbiont of Ctenocephalides felis wCfeT]|uniref:hypothetical protein n=1 Tax=Wolbachia endosymbiont of Ctenocephalides felis wCfeT TaxID=2732593 RepID=UPI00144788A6|nr:hypothetical protein [Wolbachia endosymbiont of Ctenocephalides felis wCfeT]
MGPNISEWQSMQQHQESGGEKSGFGLGHGDFAATIVDGMKWLFNVHEGSIAAFNNVFEGLVSCSSLVSLFGLSKPDNMFGIKMFDASGIAEYLSRYAGEGGEAPPEDGMQHEGAQGGGMEGPDPNDYPHANNAMAHDAEGLHDMHNEGNYRGQSFSPGPTPGHDQGHDYGHDLG